MRPPGRTSGEAVSVFGRQWLKVAGVVLACYLSVLAVLNLGSTGAGRFVDTLFPHIGPSGSLHDASILAAWSRIQSDYLVRELPGDFGTESAERGMMEALQSRYHDRFNSLLTAKESQALTQELGGRRAGSIGISVQRRCDGDVACPEGATATVLVVKDVLRGQPAEQAGVRDGDVLASINGRPIDRSALKDAAAFSHLTSMIRGDPGTTVNLGLVRSGQAVTVTVRRANLQIPSVYSQLLGRTLLVQVTQFGDDTSARSRTLLSDGLRSGATGVVLDLRHNPGGLVTAAQDLVSQFVAPAPPQREDVVVRRGRFGAGGDPASAETVAHDRLKPGGVATAPKLAVIVDSESASASEIVAAALKDYGRGQIVGQRTFGKGSVQVDFKLPDGNDLHLTVEKWFGPHGESIEETGVQPGQAITLAAPDARFRLDAESIPATQDTQLQAALAAVGRR